MSNPQKPVQDSVAELRKDINATLKALIFLAVHGHGASEDTSDETKHILQLFATHLENLLQQWPEKQQNLFDPRTCDEYCTKCNQGVGFNQALDTTAAIVRGEIEKLKEVKK